MKTVKPKWIEVPGKPKVGETLRIESGRSGKPVTVEVTRVIQERPQTTVVEGLVKTVPKRKR